MGLDVNMLYQQQKSIFMKPNRLSISRNPTVLGPNKPNMKFKLVSLPLASPNPVVNQFKGPVPILTQVRNFIF